MTETSMKPDLQNIGKTGQFWQNIQYIIGQAKNMTLQEIQDRYDHCYIYLRFISIYLYLSIY